MIKRVVLAKSAQKDLIKLPHHIVRKLMTWVDAIEQSGLDEVRKVSGYHDEALSGRRRGQRSIRLSLHYRAFYVVRLGAIEFVEIQEVNKHEY